MVDWQKVNDYSIMTVLKVLFYRCRIDDFKNSTEKLVLESYSNFEQCSYNYLYL